MPAHNITIRLLHELDEMYEAVELQKIYWGDDVESLVPAHMLFTIAKSGGHVIVAEDNDLGNRMVGVLIGLLATDVPATDNRPAMTSLMIASKRMVVLPEYRGSGIGNRLKLAQRDQAIKQGIRLISWTFDPLLAPNAYLNLSKLGCTCQKYLQDYYGTNAENPLVTLGSSDRLVADWWVTQRRVEERIHGGRPTISVENYLNANATIFNTPHVVDGKLYPEENPQLPTGVFTLLEVPLNYTAMLNTDPALAMQWQGHIRGAFQYLMSQGYIALDFVRDHYEGRDRGFYLMGDDSDYNFNLS